MKAIWFPQSDQEKNRLWVAALANRRVTVVLISGERIEGIFKRLSPMGIHLESHVVKLHDVEYVEISREEQGNEPTGYLD